MLTTGTRVKIVDGSGSPTIDQAFIGQEGVITHVHPVDDNYVTESYTVTLPDGRHDLFYDDELIVLDNP